MDAADHTCTWRDVALAQAAELNQLRALYNEAAARVEETTTKLEAAVARLVDDEHQLAELQRQLDILLKHKRQKSSEKRPRPRGEDDKHKTRPRNDDEAQKKRRENAEQKAEAATTVQLDHTVVEEARTCGDCGGVALQSLGWSTTTSYEYIPGHFERRIHRLESLKCPACGQIHKAEGPVRVVDKSPYGPGLMAYSAVRKIADAEPLYRQAKAMKRIGIPLARSTLVDLFHRSAELLAPLVERLKALVRVAYIVQADETPLRIQGEESTSYVWTFACEMAIVYVFATDRSGETPRLLLGGTVGKLVVDGYTGYNDVCTVDGRERCGCLSHARRKYIEADPVKSAFVLDAMDVVFEVEREAKGKGIVGTSEHLAMRQERSGPAMESIRSWAEENKGRVLPKGPLGQAIRYTLNQWPYLTRFLSDARVPPHNNWSERLVRIIALGRKNYLFVGHAEGGANVAILASLIATCELHGVNPQHYLADVLIRTQHHPASQIDQLLPHNWKEHFAHPT